MITADSRWPDALPPNTLCFTVDVEWAADAVVDDVRALFDAHGISATFFVTHAGVDVPTHERGLHPNYRRSGDTYRALTEAGALSDEEVYRHVIATTRAFAPEAKGVRSHSLHYDSALLPIYHSYGIEYDCSYQLPMVGGLQPFWKHHDVVGIPTYYADHIDLMEGITDFEITRLGLDRPGMKVFDFHPNILYVNAPTDNFFAATRSFYHDPEKLIAARYPGRGIRSLLLDLLAYIRARGLRTSTAGEINAAFRAANPPQRR